MKRSDKLKIFYYLISNNACQDWYRQGFYDGVNSHIIKFLIVSLSLFLLVLVTSIILSYLEKRKSKILERSVNL